MSLITYSVCISVLILAIKANTLDSSGQKTCLDEHNKYRTELAKGNVVSANGKMPGASNMHELTYSKDLEAKAQQWAGKCPGMQHTPNINYGQNIFWSSASLDQSTALKQATRDWWNEVKQYRGNNKLSGQTFSGSGHFTQMAQARATQVGCAVAPCHGTYVVCNYNAQNMLNQNIYDTGKACGQCSSSCKNSLCTGAQSNQSNGNQPRGQDNDFNQGNDDFNQGNDEFNQGNDFQNGNNFGGFDDFFPSKNNGHGQNKNPFKGFGFGFGNSFPSKNNGHGQNGNPFKGFGDFFQG